jgi:hypothetical protein
MKSQRETTTRKTKTTTESDLDRAHQQPGSKPVGYAFRAMNDSNHYAERVQRVVDYLAEHLDDALDLETSVMMPLEG